MVRHIHKHSQHLDDYYYSQQHALSVPTVVSKGLSQVSLHSFSSHELRMPLHLALSPMRATPSDSESEDSTNSSSPVERSICRNCQYVFLAAYSPVGPAFCSLDCRTSYGLHLSGEELPEAEHFDPAASSLSQPQHVERYTHTGPEVDGAYHAGQESGYYYDQDTSHHHSHQHQHNNQQQQPQQRYGGADGGRSYPRAGHGTACDPYDTYHQPPPPRAADELATATHGVRGHSGDGVVYTDAQRLAHLHDHDSMIVAPEAYRTRPSCDAGQGMGHGYHHDDHHYGGQHGVGAMAYQQYAPEFYHVQEHGRGGMPQYPPQRPIRNV